MSKMNGPESAIVDQSPLGCSAAVDSGVAVPAGVMVSPAGVLRMVALLSIWGVNEAETVPSQPGMAAGAPERVPASGGSAPRSGFKGNCAHGAT